MTDGMITHVPWTKCPHNNWLQSIQRTWLQAPVGGKHVALSSRLGSDAPKSSIHASHFHHHSTEPHQNAPGLDCVWWL